MNSCLTITNNMETITAQPAAKGLALVIDRIAYEYAAKVEAEYVTAKSGTDAEAIKAAEAKYLGLLDVKMKMDRKTKTVATYSGVMYMTVRFCVDGTYHEGWFKVTDEIPLRGMADPNNKDDKRNKFEGTRLTLECKLSNSGYMGKYLNIVNKVWLMHVNQLVSEKAFILGRRGIKPLLQTHTSMENPTEPNAPIDDPAVRFSISTGKFSERHYIEFLRGRPETEFLDAANAMTDSKGKTIYSSPMVKVDGKSVPLDWKNIHLFVKYGSRLMPGSIIHASSASVSQAWVAVSIMIHRAIIKPPVSYSGFDDDDDIITTSQVAAEFEKVTINPPATPVTVPTIESQVNEQSLHSLLDNIGKL